MQINRSPRYKNNLFQILDYIAQDKLSASENFLNELDKLTIFQIFHLNLENQNISIMRILEIWSIRVIL